MESDKSFRISTVGNSMNLLGAAVNSAEAVAGVEPLTTMVPGIHSSVPLAHGQAGGKDPISNKKKAQSPSVSAASFGEQPKRTAVGHVRVACVNCHRRHLACDLGRPCQRCASQGLVCTENVHRKRGRPRKTSAQRANGTDKNGTDKNGPGMSMAHKGNVGGIVSSSGASVSQYNVYHAQGQPLSNNGSFDLVPSTVNSGMRTAVTNGAQHGSVHSTPYSNSMAPTQHQAFHHQPMNGYVSNTSQSYNRSQQALNGFSQIDDSNLWLNVTPQGVICNFSNGWQHYLGSQYFHKLYHRPFFELVTSDGNASKQAISLIERAAAQVSAIVAQAPPMNHPGFMSTHQSSRFELSLCLMLNPTILHVRAEFTGVATFTQGNMWQIVVFINCLLVRPPEFISFHPGWTASSTGASAVSVNSPHPSQPLESPSNAALGQLRIQQKQNALSGVATSASNVSAQPMSNASLSLQIGTSTPSSMASVSNNGVISPLLANHNGVSVGHHPYHATGPSQTYHSSAPMSTLAAVASSALASASQAVVFNVEDAKFSNLGNPANLTPVESATSINSLEQSSALERS